MEYRIVIFITLFALLVGEIVSTWESMLQLKSSAESSNLRSFRGNPFRPKQISYASRAAPISRDLHSINEALTRTTYAARTVTDEVNALGELLAETLVELAAAEEEMTGFVATANQRKSTAEADLEKLQAKCDEVKSFEDAIALTTEYASDLMTLLNPLKQIHSLGVDGSQQTFIQTMVNRYEDKRKALVNSNLREDLLEKRTFPLFQQEPELLTHFNIIAVLELYGDTLVTIIKKNLGSQVDRLNLLISKREDPQETLMSMMNYVVGLEAWDLYGGWRVQQQTGVAEPKFPERIGEIQKILEAQVVADEELQGSLNSNTWSTRFLYRLMYNVQASILNEEIKNNPDIADEDKVIFKRYQSPIKSGSETSIESVAKRIDILEAQENMKWHLDLLACDDDACIPLSKVATVVTATETAIGVLNNRLDAECPVEATPIVFDPAEVQQLNEVYIMKAATDFLGSVYTAFLNEWNDRQHEAIAIFPRKAKDCLYRAVQDIEARAQVARTEEVDHRMKAVEELLKSVKKQRLNKPKKQRVNKHKKERVNEPRPPHETSIARLLRRSG